VHAVDWIVLVVVIVGIVIALFGWDRYRGSRPRTPGPGSGDDAQPTAEAFIDPETGRRMRVWYDPETGRRMRVWYDPKTGQRDYRPE
jgi:hypothetical protein